MNKEILADKLIKIIVNNTKLLTDNTINDLNGVIFLMKSLYDDYREDIYRKDITIIIDTCISILTGIENDLSNEDKESFHSISQILNINELLSKLSKGNLIVYQNIPYVISSVDMDDNAVHLFNGELDDNGIWIDGEELLQIKIS